MYDHNAAATHRAATMRVIRLEGIKRAIFEAQTDARRMPHSSEDHALVSNLEEAHRAAMTALKYAHEYERETEAEAREEAKATRNDRQTLRTIMDNYAEREQN